MSWTWTGNYEAKNMTGAEGLSGRWVLKGKLRQHQCRAPRMPGWDMCNEGLGQKWERWSQYMQRGWVLCSHSIAALTNHYGLGGLKITQIYYLIILYGKSSVGSAGFSKTSLPRSKSRCWLGQFPSEASSGESVPRLIQGRIKSHWALGLRSLFPTLAAIWLESHFISLDPKYL